MPIYGIFIRWGEYISFRGLEQQATREVLGVARLDLKIQIIL